MLPMPEVFENTKPKAVPVARPQAPKARPSRPAKPKAAKAKPAKPTAKALALQDTTKARISVQPKAKK